MSTARQCNEGEFDFRFDENGGEFGESVILEGSRRAFPKSRTTITAPLATVHFIITSYCIHK